MYFIFINFLYYCSSTVHVNIISEDDFVAERDDEGFSTSSEKATALERAKGFKSENPFIMITMQPHYIHRYTLVIYS